MATKHQVRLVDVDALAAVLDVPSHLVIEMFRDGRLPGYRLSARRIRFDVAECIAALRSRPADSISPATGQQQVPATSNEVASVTAFSEGR